MRDGGDGAQANVGSFCTNGLSHRKNWYGVLEAGFIVSHRASDVFQAAFTSLVKGDV